MKAKYTEADLRKAFHAGVAWAAEGDGDEDDGGHLSEGLSAFLSDLTPQPASPCPDCKAIHELILHSPGTDWQKTVHKIEAIVEKKFVPQIAEPETLEEAADKEVAIAGMQQAYEPQPPVNITHFSHPERYAGQSNQPQPPSDPAMKAAKEIVNELSLMTGGSFVKSIAAIIQKHLPATTQGEPVAWMVASKTDHIRFATVEEKLVAAFPECTKMPLYLAPPASVDIAKLTAERDELKRNNATLKQGMEVLAAERDAAREELKRMGDLVGKIREIINDGRVALHRVNAQHKGR